ncbi:MAG: tRNA (adenosine(37)-N6)-dimethylallyltransferase MiaA [Candidatus Binatia bacterium]|nr:tRNA (adenosine(37)-N6)-dimethylallyltransferase MiaA [Candidatus Binatia bacterium]
MIQASGEARPRVVAVVGPTAAGKTDLAAEVARASNGEVVSVDSRQVFRRLDIGTAKPSAELRADVPHHLVDVVEPDEPFDVARFQDLGRAAIEDTLGRGQAVVLCGGSGLYLRALTEGLCPAPPADPDMRAELACERAERGLEALHRELSVVDPAAAKRIAPRDAVRIIRALEVARLTGRPLSEWQRDHAFADRPYEVLVLVLSPESAALDDRIVLRTDKMWKDGLLEETRGILEAGFDGRLQPLQAIGYREAQAVLRGEMEVPAAIERIRIDTRRYAKRQRTWFRRLEGAEWLDGSESSGTVTDRAARFLERGP